MSRAVLNDSTHLRDLEFYAGMREGIGLPATEYREHGDALDRGVRLGVIV